MTGLLALLLLATPAQAEDLETSLGTPGVDVVGTFGVMGDEFVARLGPGMRATLWPERWIGAELSLWGMPDREQADYLPILEQLRTQQEVVPEVSRELFTLQGNAVFAPLVGRARTPRGAPFDIRWLVSVGGGVVATSEDTLLVQDTSPCHGLVPVARAAVEGCQYIDEAHPIFSVGIGVRASFSGVVVGFDVRLQAHPERALRGLGFDPSDPTADHVVDDKRKLAFTVSVGGAIPLPP